MRIFFVRHGESESNILKLLSHKTIDMPLTPKGIEQAHKVSQKLLGRKIERIYASPLARAIQTANVISSDLNLLQPLVLEDLREVNMGVHDGKSEVNNSDHDFVISQWLAGHFDIAFPKGESALALQKRLKTSVDVMIAEGLNAVAVAHGGIIVHGLPSICSNVSKLPENRDLDNAAIVEIEAYSRTINCLRWGDKFIQSPLQIESD